MNRLKKIHLIMPMGGGGTRFGNAGFCLPKPLIELQGRPFFYWAVQSVVKFIDVEDIIFVVLKEHIEQFGIDSKIKMFYPEAKIHIIPHVYNGAVLTCMEGVKEISDQMPVLFNDCDHAFLCRLFYKYCIEADFSALDGALLTFNSDSSKYSYVEYDEERNVIGTAEKKVISDEAICGAYYFKDKTVFEKSAETYLKRCEYQELFISGIYNEMAAQKKSIATFKVEEHIPFGTPQEYYLALSDSRLKELEER